MLEKKLSKDSHLRKRATKVLKTKESKILHSKKTTQEKLKECLEKITQLEKSGMSSSINNYRKQAKILQSKLKKKR